MSTTIATIKFYQLCQAYRYAQGNDDTRIAYCELIKHIDQKIEDLLLDQKELNDSVLGA